MLLTINKKLKISLWWRWTCPGCELIPPIFSSFLYYYHRSPGCGFGFCQWSILATVLFKSSFLWIPGIRWGRLSRLQLITLNMHGLIQWLHIQQEKMLTGVPCSPSCVQLSVFFWGQWLDLKIWLWHHMFPHYYFLYSSRSCGILENWPAEREQDGSQQ